MKITFEGTLPQIKEAVQGFIGVNDAQAETKENTDVHGSTISTDDDSETTSGSRNRVRRGKRGDVKEDDDDANADSGGADEETEAPRKSRRRSRKAKETPEDSAGGEEGTDEEKPKRRRSRKASSADDVSGEETEETPRKSRRRRGASSDDDGDNDAEDEKKPAKRSRRSRKKAEKEDEGISDLDLSKAASDAAADIEDNGTAIVREVMERFGVGSVEDIEQDERQEFLDLLKQEVEDADED